MFKSKKVYSILAVTVLSLAIIAMSGCTLPLTSAEYTENPIEGREVLTQVSTINGLMAGVYDGFITSGEMKGYGDFGIGTFDGLDGEMVMLDGKLYQVKADGIAYAVPDSLKIPFAAVTFMDNDREEKMAGDMNIAKLQETIDKAIPSANIFCAVKVTGTFSYMKTRSVPRQTKPYPVLTEVTKNQAIFEFNNVKGTLVGFRCPPYVNGVNVAGYHLHFLTEDKKAGGHVLDLKTEDVTARLDYMPEFFMILPDMDSDFYKINLSGDSSQEIEKAEK